MEPSKTLDLRALRAELGLTQSELAEMVGVSVRAIQSCEQGWRKPGPGLEKVALLLLLARRQGGRLESYRCWEVVGCSQTERQDCVVFQTRQGHLCWMLTGNRCRGRHLKTWTDKKATCFECDFFQRLFSRGVPLHSRPGGDGGRDPKAGRDPKVGREPTP